MMDTDQSHGYMGLGKERGGPNAIQIESYLKGPNREAEFMSMKMIK